MSLKLKPVGSNQTEVEISCNCPGGVATVLYSYETPVAIFLPGRGGLATTTKYSATTSRHISAAINRWGATRIDVPQFEIDSILEGGGRFS